MTSRLIDARADMKTEVDLSRRQAVALPPSFIKAADRSPALARLVLGGQGGDVRLKLFLTFLMRATKAPHNLDGRTNKTLGALLGLPVETAERRVASALTWLEQEGFIRRHKRTGEAAAISLLNPSVPQVAGVAAPWKQRDTSGAYVKVPINLWASGWIQVLSARAIGIYISIAELTSINGDEATMSGHRKRMYGYSDDTWTRALIELTNAGLVRVTVKIAAQNGQLPRRRNVYSLVANTDIPEAPTDAKAIMRLRRKPVD